MILGIDASNLRAGGGLTHLSSLLAAADPPSAGFDRVIVWGGAATLRRLPTAAWLDPRHQPLLDRALPWRLLWQSRVLPVLARRHCDLLFAPGGSAPHGFDPIVVMSRNMLPFEPSERQRYGLGWTHARLQLLRHNQSRAFMRSAGVIFLTEYARQAITRQLPHSPRNIVTIPHGVDETFRQFPRRQKALTEYSFVRPFCLLYVSIVNLYKHQLVVAEAVAALRTAGLPIRLDLVGPAASGDLRRQLEAGIRRLDPQARFITYHGAKHGIAELVHHYHAADAFVYASSCENMPNIVLEAMASGLPIASSRRGPMPEILQDGSLYFDPENAHDISRALRQLVTEPLTRQTIAERAHHLAQAYSWKKCAEQTFGFLARTATASRSVSV